MKSVKLQAQVDEDGEVLFNTQDGRTMFRVRPRPDGKSIEVATSQHCRVDGVLYDRTLSILPESHNRIIVFPLPYER